MKKNHFLNLSHKFGDKLLLGNGKNQIPVLQKNVMFQYKRKAM